MNVKGLFYMREDLKNNDSKIKVYKTIFTFSFWLGLALLIISIIPPIVPFGIFAGSVSAILGGYFLLSIRFHLGGKEQK